MFGPLLPQISDTSDALAELFALARDADVDRIWTDTLNPRPRVWPSVQRLLRDRWPDLYDHYRRVLFSPSFRDAYQAELEKHIRRAAAVAGVVKRLA